MKANEYFVNIHDGCLERRPARGKSEVRLTVSVIQPRERLRSFEYPDCPDYGELFPLPSSKLRDPEEARVEVLRMLDTASGALRRGGTHVPREDMLDIADWIAHEAADIAAAAANLDGLGASIAVHIKLFTPEPPSWFREDDDDDDDDDDEELDADNDPLSQEFQESEVDDGDDDDEELDADNDPLLQEFQESEVNDDDDDDELDADNHPLSQEFQESEVTDNDDDDDDGDGDGDMSVDSPNTDSI